MVFPFVYIDMIATVNLSKSAIWASVKFLPFVVMEPTMAAMFLWLLFGESNSEFFR